MPFARHSGFAFTPVSVRQNAPACPGVYGLSNANGWILIDAADNIQATLLNHLRHDRMTATGFTFEPCDAAQQTDRRSRLIAELHPTANRAH